MRDFRYAFLVLKPARFPTSSGSKFPSRSASLVLATLAITLSLGCDAGSTTKPKDATTAAMPGVVRISGASPSPVSSMAFGINYWQWAPTWGNLLAGTEARILALRPRLLRIGGHSNDSNDPDPFDEGEIDTAISYARAIGAEPLLQVPLLADVDGSVPTPETAAALVTYANQSRGYGVKYFSIGNEPDLYPDQEPGMQGFTANDYCARVEAFASAMRAVDPQIQIVGPDLSWKYQTPENDWLSPILAGCGAEFDVVAIHRYPVAPTETSASRASADAPQFRSTIASVREKLAAAGFAERPLALTETNLTWDGEPQKSNLEASPGTLPAALWAADLFGVSLEMGLWTSAFWSIREGWTLGLITPDAKPRPAYHVFRLYAEHFGSSLLQVVSTPSGVRAYASRNTEDDRTQIVIVNWTASAQTLTFQLENMAAPVPNVTFTLSKESVSAVDIPDLGMPTALVYGASEVASGSGPSSL